MKRILLLLLTALFSFTSLLAQESKDKVTVIYDNKWQPYSYGNDKNVKGILVDITNELLKERLKLDVEHKGMRWRKADKSIRSGFADIFVNIPTNDRLSYLHSTSNKIYSIQWKAFVSKKSNSYSKIMSSKDPLTFSGLNFVSLRGDTVGERLYKKNNLKYKRVDNISKAINMLSLGQADIVVYSKIIMMEHLNKSNQNNSIAVHDKELKSLPFTFLFSKKSKQNIDLAVKVDEVINNMKNSDEYEEFINSVEEKNIF